jgi:hypothetical protein
VNVNTTDALHASAVSEFAPDSMLGVTATTAAAPTAVAAVVDDDEERGSASCASHPADGDGSGIGVTADMVEEERRLHAESRSSEAVARQEVRRMHSREPVGSGDDGSGGTARSSADGDRRSCLFVVCVSRQNFRLTCWTLVSQALQLFRADAAEKQQSRLFFLLERSMVYSSFLQDRLNDRKKGVAAESPAAPAKRKRTTAAPAQSTVRSPIALCGLSLAVSLTCLRCCWCRYVF